MLGQFNMGQNMKGNMNTGMRMNNNMGMNMNMNMGMNIIMGGNNNRINNNFGMNNNNNFGMKNNNFGMNNNNNFRMNNNNFGMNNNNNFGMNNNNFGMNNNNINFGMNNNPNFGMNNGMNNNNFGIMQNNFVNSPNLNILEALYNQYKLINDPYEMQKKIVFGLVKNNFIQYSNYYNKNAPPLSFLTQSSAYNNNFNPSNSDIINVIFITMKGNTHLRQYNKNITIKDMLEDFVKNMGLNTNSLKRIQFLYNATLLNNLPQNMTLTQFNIGDNSRINIIDMFNVIGA